MKYHYFKFSIAIFVICLAFACSKSPNGGIPSYVQIDDVELITTTEQGSALHGISDIRLESEGENFGGYEYPAIFPVLVEGERDIIALPGIYQNGDFFSRETYPFYTPYTTSVTFTAEDTVVINPTFEYKDDLTFALVESFESSNLFAGLVRTDVSDIENIEGKSGRMYVDASTTVADATSSTSIEIPQQKRVFLEIHYKADNQFEMGLESLVNGTATNRAFFAYFEPSPSLGWAKVYFELTPWILDMKGEEYNFFFSMAHSNGQPSGSVFVDNIKIIHQ